MYNKFIILCIIIYYKLIKLKKVPLLQTFSETNLVTFIETPHRGDTVYSTFLTYLTIERFLFMD